MARLWQGQMDLKKQARQCVNESLDTNADTRYTTVNKLLDRKENEV